MKTSLATTISIVGVLAAGGVAFAVNSSVLNSATMTAENAPALQAEVLPLADTNLTNGSQTPQPVGAQGTGIDAPTTTIAPSDQGATTTTSPAAPTATAVRSAYNVQGFGVVTVEMSENSLTVVSVANESGVKNTVKQESPTRIEVVFTSSAGVGIKFHADIIDGRIVTSVMNEQPPRIGSGGGKREDHDGDRDESHESGEHDDD